MPVIKSARKLKLKLTMKNARKLATAAEHGEYDEALEDMSLDPAEHGTIPEIVVTPPLNNQPATATDAELPNATTPIELPDANTPLKEAAEQLQHVITRLRDQIVVYSEKEMLEIALDEVLEKVLAGIEEVFKLEETVVGAKIAREEAAEGDDGGKL